MAELKRIDLETGHFMANGVEYQIEGGLSIERYCEFQILEKELGYGTTFKGMFDRIKKTWDLVNKMKFAETAVELNNLMTGCKKLEEREPVILKICALFMNTPDEDRTTFTNDLITKKISDWKKEGLDMRDFFRVASDSVDGFLKTYKEVTRIISAQQSDQTGENQ